MERGCHHLMSALCTDLESIKATPWVCFASPCDCPKNSSHLPFVSCCCPEPVHLDLLILMIGRLNFVISVATCAVSTVSDMIRTFHVVMMVVVLELLVAVWRFCS
ncbi:hypothetical protein DPMN_141636 [Dreissena polymorpha]|uniref:Uncharacterized protein n=1 Tax=Dreissena polymorpha TaxID=45954 RepID=A0A9D4JK35_DREPO|nr:hypothetical protein DPMN_141636 [Dreissena polymorpha]